MYFTRSFSVLVFCCAFVNLACVEEKADKKKQVSDPPTLFAVARDRKNIGPEIMSWSEKYLKNDKGIAKYDFVILESQGLSFLKNGDGREVTINLFNDTKYRAVIDKREKRSSADSWERLSPDARREKRFLAGEPRDKGLVWVWEGHLDSIDDSSFVFTCYQEKIEGEVRTPKAIYEIRPCPERLLPGRKEDRKPSLHVVAQVKDEDFPPCASHQLEEPKQAEESKKKAQKDVKNLQEKRKSKSK